MKDSNGKFYLFIRQNTRPLNVCSKCCQKFPGDVFIKVCHACTYYNLADSVQCLICTKRYGADQKAVLSKVCPFCNHDETVGIQCTKCTIDNAIQNVCCAMCGERLRKSTQPKDDKPSHKSIETKSTQTYSDTVTKDSMVAKEKTIRFKFAEGVSIRSNISKNIANIVVSY